MESLTFYYEQIDRHAIISRPKQSLLKWINALYPAMPEDGSETTVYLVKEHNAYANTEKMAETKFQ